MARKGKRTGARGKPVETGLPLSAQGSAALSNTTADVRNANAGGAGAGAPYEAKHPDYQQHYNDWIEMRDAVTGASIVKEKAEHYLPMPSGFTMMVDKGADAYSAYLLRAQFPELTEPTIRGMLGVITRVPPKFEMPTGMDYIREAATADGLTLEALHRYVVREVLTTGRLGVLAEAPAVGQAGEPYLTTYVAESIINWSSMGDLFVLDEAGNVQQGYWWIKRKQWRILERNVATNGLYQQTVFGDAFSASGEPNVPQAVGAKPLTEVPFVVIGPLNLTPDIDEIPLLEVARAAFAEYRLDADYRHQLYMSGQETFVIIGDIEADKIPTVIGAGVTVLLPENSAAMYVGPSGVGITTTRQAIQDERQKAVTAGAKLFDNQSNLAESGEALKLRWAAQTATLLSVAMTVSAGLEKALRYIAMFKGLDPKEVIVTPNTSFVDSDMTPSDALSLSGLWMNGTLSKRTVYERLMKGGLTNTDRDFDAEKELIAEDDLERAARTGEDEGGGGEDEA